MIWCRAQKSALNRHGTEIFLDGLKMNAWIIVLVQQAYNILTSALNGPSILTVLAQLWLDILIYNQCHQIRKTRSSQQDRNYVTLRLSCYVAFTVYNGKNIHSSCFWMRLFCNKSTMETTLILQKEE